MKLQNNSYSCGVYAVLNAARCLGIVLTEKKILKYSKTTNNGTDEKGILNAIVKNNMQGEEFNVYDEYLAFESLNKALKNDNPIIIYLDREEHWCTVIGRMNSKYIVFDSDKDPINKKEHGVQILSKSELKKRWIAKNSFYGIVVLSNR
jgi:ABC-type bacteriocin/lantibiotic exporter with double-glycine peptidase domain